ncbi:hypothetical protein Tco_0285401 [Tanacetum coccineum]
MLEKGNYIPWESRFRRFLDNKLEDGGRMWNSIQNGLYQRPLVVDPTSPNVPILESLSKMTEGDSQKDKLTNTRGLLARAFLKVLYTHQQRLRFPLNKNQSCGFRMVEFEYQTKNASYGRNANKNVGRNKTQGFNAGDESNHIIQRVPRTESTPGKANV